MSSVISHISRVVSSHLSPARFKREEGDTLIEVAIAALMVGVIVIGTFMGFDASTRAGARGKMAQRAAALAHLDEARLRGLMVADLQQLKPQVRYITVDGVQYRITSTVQFYSDSGAAASCSLAGTGTADYLTTKSSVTWYQQNTASYHTPELVSESIVTPPVGGSIQVLVQESDGTAIPSAPVTLTGQSPLSGSVSNTTDSGGCAVFGGLSLGSYTASASYLSYVDVNGNSPAAVNAASIAAQTSFVTVQLGNPGAITVPGFTTTYNGNTYANYVDGIVVYHNCVLCQTRTFGTVNSYAPSYTTPTTMYPFSTTDSVYAGTCTLNAPSSNNATDPTVTVTAGNTVSTGTITLPGLNIQPYYNSSPWWWPIPTWTLMNSAPHVIITDTGCNNTKHTPPTVNPSSPPHAGEGALQYPGLPYGHYTVCVDNGSSYNTATVNMTTAAPTSQTLSINLSNSGAVCT